MDVLDKVSHLTLPYTLELYLGHFVSNTLISALHFLLRALLALAKVLLTALWESSMPPTIPQLIAKVDQVNRLEERAH